jgi:hypothetical protein
MTLFEWKITSLSNGEFGYIWIAEPSRDATNDRKRVYIDPGNFDGDCDFWLEHDPHVLFNCEFVEAEESYELILAYWHSIGSPIADRNSADYESPWFPWLEAGFTVEERDECIGSSDCEANFERAAESIQQEEGKWNEVNYDRLD